MKGYKKIGRGSFSTVYRKGNEPSVLIVSTDPVKECMGLGWFPKSRLFPKINRMSYNDDGSQTYTMQYYGKVTSLKKQLNKKSYQIYKALRDIPIPQVEDYLLYEAWIKAFTTMPKEFKRVGEILSEAVDALTNYGSDVCFEISPRNIAATKSGNLVLLDCFFMRSELIKKQYAA